MPQLLVLGQSLHLHNLSQLNKQQLVRAILAVPVPVEQYTVDELLGFFAIVNAGQTCRRESKAYITKQIQKQLPQFINVKRKAYKNVADWQKYVSRMVRSFSSITSENDSMNFTVCKLNEEINSIEKLMSSTEAKFKKDLSDKSRRIFNDVNSLTKQPKFGESAHNNIAERAKTLVRWFDDAFLLV